MSANSIDRRSFLRSSVTAVGGLIVGVPLFRSTSAGAAEGVGRFAPNAFIRIAPSGTVTLVVSMAEMGQGVRTALPMILAEELDADWSTIQIEQAPVGEEYNNPLFHMQGTGGSSSVKAFYTPLRIAGATARAMLVEAGAHRFNVAVSDCRTAAGHVIASDGRRLSYGELALEAASLTPSEHPTLKPSSEFRLIGKEIHRTDSADKVRGKTTFGLDIELPGMLTAVVAHPPSIGAKLVSFDASKALQVKGVHQVVAISAGIAVVADGFHAARKGRDALTVQWDESAGAQLSSASIRSAMTAQLSSESAILARELGEVDSVQGKTHEVTYAAPYLAHACMEPMNATAHVTADHCAVYAPTQAPGPHRAMVAGMLGLKPEQVTITQTFLGGGFGRRFCPDFIMAAVETSKAANAPVKVVYTREDDMRAQFYRPGAMVRFAATVDAKGQPLAFKARVTSSSISRAAGMGPPDGLDASAVEGLSNWPYKTPNLRVDWVEHKIGPSVWFWRSVGSSQNAFFAESFIDELAHHAGRDPYAYRRELLADEPRLVRVLDLAAEKAGWGTPLPKGHARGIAVAESFASYVAEVVEVSLDADGTPRIHKVVAAVDCGTIVNPSIVRRQVQSAVIYGLSAALTGQITLSAGHIEQGNFDTYPVVRMPEAPVIDVHLVDSQEPPTGIGEPGTPPLAPALTNALYALTGKRIRELPLSASLTRT
jgi:isoquinoline 1-oxidoreductase beta subunit